MNVYILTENGHIYGVYEDMAEAVKACEAKTLQDALHGHTASQRTHFRVVEHPVTRRSYVDQQV